MQTLLLALAPLDRDAQFEIAREELERHESAVADLRWVIDTAKVCHCGNDEDKGGHDGHMVTPMGDPIDCARYLLGLKAGEKRPCERCSACDEAKFRAWAKRIREEGTRRDGLPEGKRVEIAGEILHDLAGRHPLGIVGMLAGVLTGLNCCDRSADLTAADDLLELAEDECKARERNPGDTSLVPEHCSRFKRGRTS